jgi:hypothetical protein
VQDFIKKVLGCEIQKWEGVVDYWLISTARVMWYHVFVIAFMAAKTFPVYWKEQDCQSAGEK